MYALTYLPMYIRTCMYALTYIRTCVFLLQVVVGSEASTVTVWDIDTGRKVLHFPHCHGDQEITCMLVDMGGRRFLTGSRYGEVKVWNSSTGECLKVLHHDHKTEVTGIVGINDRRLLLTVGWNKQVVVFPDDEDVSELILCK